MVKVVQILLTATVNKSMTNKQADDLLKQVQSQRVAQCEELDEALNGEFYILDSHVVVNNAATFLVYVLRSKDVPNH
jgi:hypothetical protein